MSLALITIVYEWRRYFAAIIALALSGLLVLIQVGLFVGIGQAFTVGLGARVKTSAVKNAAPVSLDIGAVDLWGPRPQYRAEPDLPSVVERAQDHVRQTTLSANYGLAWGERLELRAGAHVADYAKTVDPIGPERDKHSTMADLYNASLIIAADARTTLFASYVTGLEETGSAPPTATNRNAVLPPVEARQIELGVRRSFGSGLSVIAAAFDIEKPAASFNADGAYELVGQVRHRGLEGSMTGRIFDGGTIVLGAVYLDASQRGPLVAGGALGDEPIGVSKWLAVAGFNQQLPFARAWTLDGQMNYQGSRWIDAGNRIEAPSYATFSFGARRQIEAFNQTVDLRFTLQNAFDKRAWTSDTTGSLQPIPPRTVRVLLTTRFG